MMVTINPVTQFRFDVEFCDSLYINHMPFEMESHVKEIEQD